MTIVIPAHDGLPDVNLLITSDEKEAAEFISCWENRFHFGLTLKWKPSIQKCRYSRVALLQVCAGPWVLVFDLARIRKKTTKPLPKVLRNFLENQDYIFYGMGLLEDMARLAFEFDCVANGVDFAQGKAWKNLIRLGGGLCDLANRVLGTTVRQHLKNTLAIRNWEAEPLLDIQHRYLAEDAYLSWTLATHFRRQESPREDWLITVGEIYSQGKYIIEVGHSVPNKIHEWTEAREGHERNQKEEFYPGFQLGTVPEHVDSEMVLTRRMMLNGACHHMKYLGANSSYDSRALQMRQREVDRACDFGMIDSNTPAIVKHSIDRARFRLIKLCGIWKDKDGSLYDLVRASDGNSLDVTKVTAWRPEQYLPGVISLETRGEFARIVWGVVTKRKFTLHECSDYKLVWTRADSYTFEWERETWSLDEIPDPITIGQRETQSPPIQAHREPQEVSCNTASANKSFKMGIVYWGDMYLAGTNTFEGWDITGRCPGGFPSIDPRTDALRDCWKGRMDNVHTTLRVCAADGHGFKKYVQHFMMLSSQACMEYDLHAFHQHNKRQKKKVLTERAVIGAILESFHGLISENSGLVVSNGGPHVYDFADYLHNRARSYKEQAHKLGGYFVAIVLECSGEELRLESAMKVLQSNEPCRIERLLIIVGGVAGITSLVREKLRSILEEHTDFPLLSVSLLGGAMHSYYALSTLLVFYDQGALLPFLQHQIATYLPRQIAHTSDRKS